MKQIIIYFLHNPWPPRSGAHSRCLQMVRSFLEMGYSVTLASSTLHSETEWTKEACDNLRALGVKDVVVYEPQRPVSWVERAEERVSRLRYTKDGLVGQYYFPVQMKKWFNQLLGRVNPDVVFINYLWFDQLVDHRRLRHICRIIDTHDIITINKEMRQKVLALLEKFKKNGSLELFNESLQFQQAPKVDPRELGIYEKYSAVLAISLRDEQVLSSSLRNSSVYWVPALPVVMQLNNTYSGNALFVNGSNPCNVQGLLYFVHCVLPIVRCRCPDFIIDVVGSYLKDVEGIPGVRQHGYLQDLTPFYSSACMFLCPTFMSTGQQVKIVEAMGNGLAVIALRAAAQASLIESDLNGIIANGREDYAEQVVRLWKSRKLCQFMGGNARESVINARARININDTLLRIIMRHTPRT